MRLTKYGGRMKKNQTIVIVLLLIIELIFIAGCVAPNILRNRTTIPTQCSPEYGNVTPWIIINPISNHVIGDVFEINGTTNLGVDKKLKITVNEERKTGVGPYDFPVWNYTYTDSRGYVTMNGGDCEINSWAYQVNLTEFHGQKIYSVNVYSEQNQTIINYSYFFVRRGE
jgi:hypothetical protein